jgi:hypothetical protein
VPEAGKRSLSAIIAQKSLKTIGFTGVSQAVHLKLQFMIRGGSLMKDDRRPLFFWRESSEKILQPTRPVVAPDVVREHGIRPEAARG